MPDRVVHRTSLVRRSRSGRGRRIYGRVAVKQSLSPHQVEIVADDHRQNLVLRHPGLRAFCSLLTSTISSRADFFGVL